MWKVLKFQKNWTEVRDKKLTKHTHTHTQYENFYIQQSFKLNSYPHDEIWI